MARWKWPLAGRRGAVSAKKDLTGQRFGRLVVVGPAEPRCQKATWKCVCDCGNTTESISNNLLRGRSTSCGCYRRERTIECVKKPPNEYVLLDDGKTAKLTLTGQGGVVRGYTLVDVADLALVLQYRWCWRRSGRGGAYAAAYVPGGTPRLQSMHQMLLRDQLQAGYEGDHRSGDTLDNRRENLRVATHQQNCFNKTRSTKNTTGYKGLQRTRYGWTASIKAEGKNHHLGTFPTPETAALAHNEAAVRLHGEFAHLNEVPSV